jgi:NhaA family Na+:H+ antiporter
VFAFLSAGVTVGGLGGLGTAFGDRVTLGIVAGLVIGKPVGVFAATWVVARFTRADLDDGLAWIDVAGLAVLAGMGFTVSLLIGELAFGAGSGVDEHAKIGVLTGSIGAAVLAAIILRARNRTYRQMAAADQSRDGDAT